MRNKNDKKVLKVSLRDIIIGGIITSIISGILGGLMHLAIDNFHLENKVENICDILNKQNQSSCKQAVQTIMEATENDIENYTVDLK